MSAAVVRGGRAAEQVEVHAVQHLDPVRSSARAPPRSPRAASAGVDSCPGVTSPGASTSTNGTRPPARFLSRSTSASTSSTDAPAKRQRQPARGQQLGHLGAQRVAAGQPQRRQQPEPDRLAVAVARVAGGRLDRVADGVAQVQHLAPPAVALVLGHHRELRAQRSP